MLKPNPASAEGIDLDALFAGVAPLRRIGLAVSGGPDSLALMLLVSFWLQPLCWGWRWKASA